MENESFENEEVAKIMNDNFINIKVDGEKELRETLFTITMQIYIFF